MNLFSGIKIKTPALPRFNDLRGNALIYYDQNRIKINYIL